MEAGPPDAGDGELGTTLICVPLCGTTPCGATQDEHPATLGPQDEQPEQLEHSEHPPKLCMPQLPQLPQAVFGTNRT